MPFGSFFAIGEAAVGVVAAGRLLVNIPLSDGCGDHCHGSEEETAGDSLDRCKVKVGLSTGGVYEFVHDGNKDDDEERVEVGYDIVGDTA